MDSKEENYLIGLGRWSAHEPKQPEGEFSLGHQQGGENDRVCSFSA